MATDPRPNPVAAKPSKARQHDAQLAVLMAQEAEANERARRQAKLYIVKIPLAVVGLVIATFVFYLLRGK